MGLKEAVELDAQNLVADTGSLVSSLATKTVEQAYTDSKGKLTPLGAWKQEYICVLHVCVCVCVCVCVRVRVRVCVSCACVSSSQCSAYGSRSLTKRSPRWRAAARNS